LEAISHPNGTAYEKDAATTFERRRIQLNQARLFYYFTMSLFGTRQLDHCARRSTPVWFFLAGRHFAAKTPPLDRWICLDFLGFSRPKRDLSMRYAGFSLKNFSSRFIPGVRIAETRTTDLGRRRRGTVHRASLAQFLILCKKLQPKPFLGRLNKR
jgi:hypothetical protein